MNMSKLTLSTSWVISLAQLVSSSVALPAMLVWMYRPTSLQEKLWLFKLLNSSLAKAKLKHELAIFCPVTTRKTRTLTKNIGSWNLLCRFQITQLDKIWRKNFHNQQFCFPKFVSLFKNFVNKNFLLSRNFSD